jgi:hypothetical protein
MEPSSRSSQPLPTILPGHLGGSALVAAEQYVADGLLAPDGELRLHLYRKELDGSIASSAQVVATVTTAGSRASGTGAVIGQRCTAPLASRFCGNAAPATISLIALAGTDPTSRGELTVTTAAGTEIWWLNMGYWGGRAQLPPTPLPSTRGLFRETLGEFAAADAVIIDVDAGRFFFQSSDTSCTGNGTLSSAFDGIGILRAELTIAGCVSGHASLNAHFVGLAVFEAETPWDPVPWGPKLWLSTDSGRSVALTTFATDF